MKRALRVPALALIATSLLAIGCAPSGDDPLSRLETWEPESGEYRVRYLSPPWQLAEEDPRGVFLYVESTLMSTGRVDGGAGKYELRTSVIGMALPAEMEREVRASRREADREILDGPREITTREGIEGQELLTFDPPDPFERYRRVVLFPLGPSRTLRLDFEATPELDRPETTEMIRSVGIGASDP